MKGLWIQEVAGDEQPCRGVAASAFLLVCLAPTSINPGVAPVCTSTACQFSSNVSAFSTRTAFSCASVAQLEQPDIAVSLAHVVVAICYFHYFVQGRSIVLSVATQGRTASVPSEASATEATSGSASLP